MKQTMKQWLEDLRTAAVKKPFPILSFPTVQLMSCSVEELVSSSDRQGDGIAKVAARVDSAAAIGFMDLSVEAECFGAQLVLMEGEVPSVTGSIITEMEEAEALHIPEVGAGRTGIYVDGIKKAVEQITDRPVFAGMIGPYSLAGRLFGVTESMYMCYDEPETVELVLEKVTEFLIAYGKAYKAVGAGGIMIAEPLAGTLSPAMEAQFSAPYVKKIVEALQDEDFLIVYHNCGNSVPFMLDSILSNGAAAYHFGNSVSMKEILEKADPGTVIMGNVDPSSQFRNGTPESVAAETKRIMGECCSHPNFVISSGCDIPPLSPWENIDAFFGAAAEFYGA